ncbi:virulence factor Pgp3 [Chlamydiifrater phoenicopteri]|uniref:virulence factor Pgp3 n=1 Tax=Chlamydiifrater phoenicopteri TaxID=2681469 RepID=UPI001BCE6ED1|nr:virulence factor Pgp3 [Chlamydiifrater phoenicopteri]
MGDSGFKLSESQNVVFADNIMVGQMKKPLSKNQIILGQDALDQRTTSGPIAAKLIDGAGIKINFPQQNEGDLSFDINAETIKDDVIDKIGDKLTDSISNSLVDKVIGELESNPNFAIKKAFKTYSFSDIVLCDGLFSSSNIKTDSCGTEVCKITITPENVNSAFLVFTNIIASRREGTIVLSLTRSGDDFPKSFGFGYSNGNPNCCQLNTVIYSERKNPITLSLRVGGMDSGPVIINGMSNGDKILGTSVSSTISILEVTPQNNG